jgi:hypothetical protein
MRKPPTCPPSLATFPSSRAFFASASFSLRRKLISLKNQLEASDLLPGNKHTKSEVINEIKIIEKYPAIIEAHSHQKRIKNRRAIRLDSATKTLQICSSIHASLSACRRFFGFSAKMFIPGGVLRITQMRIITD